MDITCMRAGTAGTGNDDDDARLDARGRGEFLRNRAIVDMMLAGESAARAAGRYGVTRQWAYVLKRRWDEEGEAGLLPRSRRARRIANKTGMGMERRIVELRLRLVAEGLDAGAESIAARLEREGVKPPANSTIHRILKDAGLVTPEPRKRPKSSYTRFEAVLPNETWQSDFTHWPTADGTDALIVSWIDDHSRFLLSARAYPTVTMDVIEHGFLECCRVHGIPASTLTDNGTVYTTRLVRADPGHFERTLALMGIRQKNGRPYHPQTQGKTERYHRTLKQWLGARPLAAGVDELNGQLAGFLHTYNEERPHRALNRHTPGEAYRAMGKAGPDPELAARAQARADEQARLDAERERERSSRRKPLPREERRTPEPVDVSIPARRQKTDRRGCVTRHAAGRERTINTGKHNAGRMVESLISHGTILVTDLETGEILVDQPLDTTRNYQYRTTSNTDTNVNHAPTHM